ncbi:hypothetical protein [Nonlabens ulvanivorans]|uniref:hypothetical protein n=1 Tax=Nonlabens ulvanivorans TaxID=906888 RepID=UPI0037C53AF7
MKKLITLVLILLAAIFSKAQSTNSNDHSFIENIGVKINYSKNFGFQRDPLPDLLDWKPKNSSTFRLGLSYDWNRNKKLNYNFNLSIDWLTDKSQYIVNDPDFDSNSIRQNFSYNGTVYFIFETQFLYRLNKKGNLYAMAAPQINYFLFNDPGSSVLTGTNNLNGYSFSLSRTERNRIIRPSLALGLQYDLNTKTKMRLGAFYSYSFTPIYFGEFTYENSNGVTASGDWEFNGHQAGITFQIFPFFKRGSN